VVAGQLSRRLIATKTDGAAIRPLFVSPATLLSFLRLRPFSTMPAMLTGTRRWVAVAPAGMSGIMRTRLG